MLSLLQWCNYITDCLPLEKIKLGQSLWLFLTVYDFKVSTEHYNALLKLYVDNEHTFSTAKLMTDMYSKQIYPNKQSYDMCIKYCCKKGNIDEALKLIQDMKMYRINISESVLNSLMIGYSQSGDILSINEIKNVMKQNKLSSRGDTYAAVLYVYAVLNDINKVKETIENCYLKNIYFDNQIILNTIYIFVKNNHLKDIRTVYQYLIKKRMITNCEVQIILKLLDINYSIAIDILVIISLDNNHPHFKNIITLILKHLVNNRVALEDIIKLFVCFKDESIFRKSLLVLLYYSLLKCDNLSLSVLKICKNHYLIKPHYFWPLLVRQAYKYNLQGILDILQIMINDFNIKPCVDTITDYILPFIFGDIHNIRNVLIKHRVNATVVNNAYVLFMLRRYKIKTAAKYMKYFQDKYFYKIISVDLRYVLVSTTDVMNFIFISSNLVEDTNSYKSCMMTDQWCNIKLVPMDRQFYDCILDFPFTETWFKRVRS
ncbi:Leucine-rich PPR motif-containing protein, mitochondrial [Eufriesea mexicana]|uniref:Leucine-rich PPR motif-containing protein, mitochondrial n=1 Tax=Eufriesea mexicana TaxID=516756 RepID=A0A310STG6_9HYME|nr:Leucine-rich PPR motif-containing protein, mitochondrial [Eufriesea mexicana]